MNEKKNIDQLFKEQFQDFDAAPSPAVWNAIEAKLKEKKKEDRKVIPLWWRVAGVAALIALLFTIGFSLLNTSTAPSNQFVIEKENPEIQTNTQDNDLLEQQTSDKSTEVASENDTSPTHSGSEDKTTLLKNETTLISEENKKQATNVSENAIAETTEDKRTTNYLTPKNSTEKKTAINYNTKKEAVASVIDATTKIPQKTETAANSLVKNNTAAVSEKTAVATVENKKVSEENKVDKTKESNATNTEIAITDTQQENKKSIFDAIEENKQLEDAIIKKEGPSNRWAVAPNVGPVYYGSLSEGSSIDPMFADNNQSGDVNLSYGVQVAYDISEKITVRTGVNNVNLSYATNDVQVASAPVAFGLETIDYGGRSAITTVFDKGTLPPTSTDGGFGNIVPKSTGGNASISQQLRYYEVPLELKYDLFENRFGVHVIGGMSTLFLGNNELVVNDGDFRTVLGEANNLNSISFTTNIGLGFNYQLSKKLKFNIEPMFKYQLNPYTDTSIDFRPYYLGVYSGLSFKF